jgi:hypothetical protein
VRGGRLVADGREGTVRAWACPGKAREASSAESAVSAIMAPISTRFSHRRRRRPASRSAGVSGEKDPLMPITVAVLLKEAFTYW